MMALDHTHELRVRTQGDRVVLTFLPTKVYVALAPETAVQVAQAIMKHAYALMSARSVAEEPSLIQEIPT